MRRLLLALLLANVLVFGWGRGWFAGVTGSSTVGPEENAHRLRPVPLSRLVASEPGPAVSATPAPSPTPPSPTPPSQTPQSPTPPSQTPQSPTPPSPTPQAQNPQAQNPQAQNPQRPTSQPQTPPAQPVDPSTQEPAAAVPADPPAPLPPPDAPAEPVDDVSATPLPLAPVVCRAFAPIDEERALVLRDALEQSGARVDAQRIEQGASYLVYLPPAASVDEAQRNLLDARRIGRDDAFVIQDGSLRLAVSLGLFRFESTARVMVEQLVRAGETRALVAPRPPIQVRIALQASWPQAQGAELATMLGAQFDASVRDCP